MQEEIGYQHSIQCPFHKNYKTTFLCCLVHRCIDFCLFQNCKRRSQNAFTKTGKIILPSSLSLVAICCFNNVQYNRDFSKHFVVTPFSCSNLNLYKAEGIKNQQEVWQPGAASPPPLSPQRVRGRALVGVQGVKPRPRKLSIFELQ